MRKQSSTLIRECGFTTQPPSMSKMQAHTSPIICADTKPHCIAPAMGTRATQLIVHGALTLGGPLTTLESKSKMARLQAKNVVANAASYY